MRKYDVRCYFVGSGDIAKANCVVVVNAPDDWKSAAVIEHAKLAAERTGLFRDMAFCRATVKEQKEKRP